MKLARKTNLCIISKHKWPLLVFVSLIFLMVITSRSGNSSVCSIYTASQYNPFLELSSTPSPLPVEDRHIVFIKVHKAASTTMMNVMLRFAINRNLTIMLPKHQNIINEKEILMDKDILNRPLSSKTRKYDILCNHVIHNKTVFQSYFPEDTKYIAILREPFEQFLSAFLYYTHVYPRPYLNKLPQKNPLTALLKNPTKYEPLDPTHSMTNNRMSVDLGYPSRNFSDANLTAQFIKNIAKDFDLVMISEYFVESVVLLRRILNWKLKDILYMTSNSFSKHKNELNMSADMTADRYRFKQWAKVDVALYAHFYDIFWEKVREQGQEFFSEVRTFRNLQKTMAAFCLQTRSNKAGASIILNKTHWNPDILVTKAMCKFMMGSELNIMEDIKKRREYKVFKVDGNPWTHSQ